MKILIESGNKDRDNNKVFVDGIDLKNNPVKLLENFDITRPLGLCHVFKQDGKLYTHFIDTYNHVGCQFLYPAIGFKVIKGEWDLQNAVFNILESELLCVSLCSGENSDPLIKSIHEQLNQK